MIFRVNMIFCLSIFCGSLAHAQVHFDIDTLSSKTLIDTSLPGTSPFIHLAALDVSPAKGISVLPVVVHNRFNAGRPIAGNDGNFAAYSGFQSVLQAGLSFRSRFLEARLSPQLHSLLTGRYDTSRIWGTARQPDTWQASLQGSYVQLNAGKISLRAAESNFVWGFTYIDHLLMSANAPGFKHFALSTNKPIGVGVGTLAFELVSGGLRSNPIEQPQENNLLKAFPERYRSLTDRHFNGMVIVFTPKFLQHSSFALSRQFQYTVTEMNRIRDPLNKYLPVLVGIFKNSIGGRAEDTIRRDQQISLNYRLRIPSARTELSVEYGWNDHKWNARDLLLSWPHSLAYIIGIKKIFIRRRGYADLVVEYTHMKQQLEYVMRDAGDWYYHYQSKVAFTHQGQILGVGGSNGSGLNKFTVQYRVRSNDALSLFSYQLVSNDHAYLGVPIWKDHVFTLGRTWYGRHLSVRSEIKAIHTNGYAFVQGMSKTSMQMNCSLFYAIR